MTTSTWRLPNPFKFVTPQLPYHWCNKPQLLTSLLNEQELWFMYLGRGSSAGVANRLWSGRSEIRMPIGGDFLISQTRPVSPSRHFNWHRGSKPRVNRPEREVHHSPTLNAEVQTEWSYASTPTPFLCSVDKDNVCLFFLYIHGSVHRESNLITVQLNNESGW